MISTSSRWVPESPMFVGDLSLKAECGSRTPWHALACPGTLWPMQVSKLVVSQGFMQDMAWIWCLHFLACRIVLYRHAVKSSQAERKQRSSVWTTTETFLSSPMMGRRWFPDAAYAACGCKFGKGSVDDCRNRMSKQDRTTHLQSLPISSISCCRSVGYFLGALAEVLICILSLLPKM